MVRQNVAKQLRKNYAMHEICMSSLCGTLDAEEEIEILCSISNVEESNKDEAMIKDSIMQEE